MTTNTPRTRRQLREALDEALDAARKTKARNQDELKTRYNLLTSDGWDAVVAYGAFGDPYTRWVRPQRITQADVDKAVAANEADTRRKTLETVIDALKLTEYGYHEPGAYYYGLNAKPGHERLWSDLQTTLSVREEQKHAETRKKTAERVAGLTKPKFPVTLNGSVIGDMSIYVDGAIDASKIRANCINNTAVSLEDIEATRKAGENLAKKKPAAKKGGKK